MRLLLKLLFFRVVIMMTSRKLTISGRYAGCTCSIFSWICEGDD